MYLSLDEVLALLKSDPTPDLLERVNDTQCTPLLEAINEKRQEDIDFLLSQKANVHARDEYNESPIIIACKQNNPELVIQLVNCGANVDEWIRSTMTPLMFAIAHDRHLMVNVLLTLGATVNIHNKHGVTPLCVAVQHNRVVCGMMLLMHGADPYIRHFGRECPVQRTVEFNFHEILHEIVQMTDIREQPILYSLIELSIQKKHTMCLAELLHDKIDQQILNQLLFYAIEKAYMEEVVLLFQHGADANCTDFCERTPILWAANYRDRELFDICLDYGADINKSSPTVLSILCRHGNVSFVKHALSKGAKINTMNRNTTALIEAARYGNDDIIHILIQHGADVSIKNLFKESPSQIAHYNYHHTCKTLLQKVEQLATLPYTHDMFSEMLNITITHETWVHALSKPARRKAIDILLETRQDEIACFVALFEGEDRVLQQFRKGEEVHFSESWVRGLVRPSGNRMYRRKLLRYLVHPYTVRHAFHQLTSAFSG